MPTKKNFVGSKMVIAAAGVDHDELVYRASQKFGSLPMSTEVSKREVRRSSVRTNLNYIFFLSERKNENVCDEKYIPFLSVLHVENVKII